jgi:SAM-dependent methyltransferase
MVRCDPLLRLLYRVAPLSLYDTVTGEVVKLKPRLAVDVGGGSGLLGKALRRKGFLGEYVLVEPDACLAKRALRDAFSHIVVGVAESLPLRRVSGSVTVFHDSLHHVAEPYLALREAMRVSECILIGDFDASSLLGKLLTVFEKILGYPASFLELREVLATIESGNFRVVKLRVSRLGSYLSSTCKN